MKPILLTEKTHKQFIRNIKQKKHMVVWCFYYWSDSPTSIDIAQTYYSRDGGFSIIARGIGYINLLPEEMDILDKWTYKAITKYIHSFLVVDKPIEKEV